MTGDTTPTTRPALAWGASTDTGQVRTENEDNYVAEPLVFGVADGMGGHQAGEVASQVAVDIIRERLGGGARSSSAAVAAVLEANTAILRAASKNAAQRGMGTTLTALAVVRDEDSDDRSGGDAEQVVLINVGDSRAYLFRDGVLRRASIDHSYVQELVATGHITEAEARTRPRRNIVTRALGIEPTVRVDSWTLPLVLGDRYVLCSDGLVDEVSDHEIADIIGGVDDPQLAADELVAMANRHGGRDNVTVIVIDVLVGAHSAGPASDFQLPGPPDGAPSAAGALDVSGTAAATGDGGESIAATSSDAADVWAIAGGTQGAGGTQDAGGLPAGGVPAGGPDAGTTQNGGAAASDALTGADDDATSASPAATRPLDQPSGDQASAEVATANTDTTDTGNRSDETSLLATSTVGDPAPGEPASGDLAPTQAIPLTAHRVAEPPLATPRRRRFTLGTFLFLFALAVILTVTGVLIAVAVRNDDESPSTTVPSTAVPTTITSTTTTTTAPATSSTSPVTTGVTAPPAAVVPSSTG